MQTHPSSSPTPHEDNRSAELCHRGVFQSMNGSGQIRFRFYGLVSVSVNCPTRIARFLRSEWGAFADATQAGTPDIIARWGVGPREVPEHHAEDALRRTGGWYKGCFWRALVARDGRGATVH